MPRTATNPETGEKLVLNEQTGQWEPASSAPEGMGTVEDVARSAGSGAVKGLAYLAGTPGDVGDMMVAGTDWLARKAGIEPPSREEREVAAPPVNLAPTSNQIIGVVQDQIGPLHEPQTTAGKYAHTAGEFLPAAAGGIAGLGRRLIGRVAAPAGFSEGASQFAEAVAPESGLEPWARAAGALAGGLAGPKMTSMMAPAAPNMSRGATRIMSEAIAPDTPGRLATMGPDAMLLDASPSALGTAQGVVTKPGRGRDILVDALTERHRQRSPRLLSEVDETLGATQPPAFVDRDLVAQQRSLGPAYSAVKEAADPVDLSEMGNQLRQAIPTLRGKPRAALEQVAKMIDGDTGLSATEAHNIRRAIDDAAQSKDIGSFERTLLTDARTMVDNQLATAVPGIKNLDETYQNLAREREALETGQGIFDSGKTGQWPEELAETMSGMRGPERAAMRTGARAEIERVMRQRDNDMAALRQVVKGEGDWNRAKLAQVFGEAEADRIISAVDREAAFADAYNKVVQNSQTAQRQMASRMIDAESEAPIREIPPFWERAGALPEQIVRGAGRGIRHGIEAARSDRTREELARLLTARGADRDRIVQDVLATGARSADRAALARLLMNLRASQGELPAAGQ